MFKYISNKSNFLRTHYTILFNFANQKKWFLRFRFQELFVTPGHFYSSETLSPSYVTWFMSTKGGRRGRLYRFAVGQPKNRVLVSLFLFLRVSYSYMLVQTNPLFLLQALLVCGNYSDGEGFWRAMRCSRPLSPLSASERVISWENEPPVGKKLP